MQGFIRSFAVAAVLVYIFQDVQSSLMSNLYHAMENAKTNSLTDGSAKQSWNLPPDLSTVDLITSRGYPVETHEILTKDGYILTAFRIPHGKSPSYNNVHQNNNYNTRGHNRYPVYLMHGGAMSSSDWLVNLDQNNCLPFLLADQGYDVWLGNIRGNMYANKHITFSHEQTKFWNFSFDEAAEYDVPDAIDYILSKTQTRKLHYIGYSLGNTQFFMSMARRPEYNSKIALHVSYAASVFWSTTPDTHVLNARLTTKPMEIFQKLTGGVPVPPQGITFMLNQLLSRICNPKIDLIGVCRQVLFLIMGFGPEQISRAQTPSLLGHLLTPTSLKMLIHLQQLTNSDRFCRYDYGGSKNQEFYGQPIPPAYDISLITAPVSLVLAPNDMFANSRGYKRLAKALPNLVDFYTIPFQNFTHIDFVYGSDARKLVYDHTINIINRFSYYN